MCIAGGTESDLTISGTSSSSADPTYTAAFGKLGYSSTKSWRPTSNTNAYLEVQTSTDNYVTAIKTKGGTSGYYVTSFSMHYYNSSAGSWVG